LVSELEADIMMNCLLSLPLNYNLRRYNEAAITCHHCKTKADQCTVTGYPIGAGERVMHEGRGSHSFTFQLNLSYLCTPRDQLDP
jgi:hypothetical protein